MIKDDKEYIYWLKILRNNKISKETWSQLSEEEASTFLNKIRELREYYYDNKSRFTLEKRLKKYKHLLSIDPYGEEDWDN
jgi:hypothetical protein